VHPRNPHRTGYDFVALVAASPELAPFVIQAPHGGASIDFAEPAAVKALNRALLRLGYGIGAWDIPPGYLCPPIPGRADYLHHLADLLSSETAGTPAGGSTPVILDIGVGANCIYPLIGHHDYGWRFVGVDIDPVALRSAASIVESNPALRDKIELRLQTDARHLFRGVVRPADRFAATICNPPFHASAEAAATGTRRKICNLGGRPALGLKLNFGGTPNELWCPGGELAFVRRMISESVGVATQVGWFTTLVSKSEHLPAIRDALARIRATEVRTIEMSQGQKKSRFVAWRFEKKDGRNR
jgi:23S rRNA (adenine1618-N6)-methyltransferase